eukprot:COSAG02_NODE_11377_length_1737_cov_1.789988_1_plen_166_part_00
MGTPGVLCALTTKTTVKLAAVGSSTSTGPQAGPLRNGGHNLDHLELLNFSCVNTNTRGLFKRRCTPRNTVTTVGPQPGGDDDEEGGDEGGDAAAASGAGRSAGRCFGTTCAMGDDRGMLRRRELGVSGHLLCPGVDGNRTQHSIRHTRRVLDSSAVSANVAYTRS